MVFSSRVSWSALVPVALVLGFAGLLVLGQRLGATPIPHALLWHQVLELVAVIIAALIFVVAWASQAQTGKRVYAWLACGFLAVGLLDFSHALAFPGMPDFVTANTTEKTIAFWLAARYVSALVLLYAVAALRQKNEPPARPLLRHSLLLSTVFLVAAFHVVVLAFPQVLPRTYIEGSGLTAFKVWAELGIMGLHVLALALLWRGDPVNYWFPRSWMSFALLGLVLGEVFFVLYGHPSDVLNLAGHVFKVVAYVCLYRAVFVETVAEPYQALRAANARLQSVFDALPDPLFDLDADGRILDVQMGSSTNLPLTPADMVGRQLVDLMSGPSAAAMRQLLHDAAQQGQARMGPVAVTVRGEVRHYEMSVARRTLPGPRPVYRFLLLARDVTERVRDLGVLRRLQVAVEQSPSTIMITDLSSRLIYANRAFTRSTGYTVEEAMGASPRLLHSGKTPRAVYEDLWHTLARGEAWRGEFINRRKDGTDYLESVLISPVVDAQGHTTSYLAIKEDITAQRRDQERIRQLSNFDRLTGLPNRQLLGVRFDEIAARARRQRQPLAVISVGLDQFKQINDTLGHLAGDEILITVARRLVETVGLDQVVARYSGDEFTVVLALASLKEATRWVERIREALRLPHQVAGRALVITASVGVALLPDDGDTLAVLLQRANTALGQAKALGRDRHLFFSAELQERSSRMLQLSSALRQAIDRNELRLVYQPKLDVRTGHLSGVEALLRWQHPELGWVSPSEFIPVAESNGLIVPIGAWVLREAVRQAKAWQSDGLPPFVVAVNLSLGQLHDGSLLHDLDAALAESGLAPAWLELELTESMAMDDPEGFLAIVAELHVRGVRLALDDFGTGYSSLSHLKRMRLHHLKIDKSFVDELTTDETALSIVTAVIQMAHSLGLQTTAEGVETEAQVATLRQLGCEEIQGYWYSRPLPPAELAGFVQQAASR